MLLLMRIRGNNEHNFCAVNSPAANLSIFSGDPGGRIIIE